MINKIWQSNIKAFFIIGIISLLCLSGCREMSPSATPTPTIASGGDSEESEVLKISCPDEKTLFSLWFSHYAVLDIDAGGGETFYLKFENTPPSYFDLWIEADGTISNEGIYRKAPIGYQGTFKHPDDNDCPVQTFAGTWQMQAKITGTCQNDLAKIHIIEEWIDPVLNSDCVPGSSPGPGLYSGPELDLVFNLADAYPADFVEIPEGGQFYATYAYHSWPAGYELPIVPLVPEQ